MVINTVGVERHSSSLVMMYFCVVHAKGSAYCEGLFVNNRLMHVPFPEEVPQPSIFHYSVQKCNVSCKNTCHRCFCFSGKRVEKLISQLVTRTNCTFVASNRIPSSDCSIRFPLAIVRILSESVYNQL